MNQGRHMDWRAAPRFPAFEVSEFGDVRRIGTTSRIAGQIDPDGYIRYSLTRDDGVRVTISAHRLVIETFVGRAPSPQHVVAHNNGSRIHNHYSNLRWTTLRGNHNDRAFHGNTPAGVRNPKARITEADVRNIRRDYRLTKQRGSGKKVGELSEKYGLCRTQIIRIASGEAWAHVPMQDFSEMETGR